MILNEPSEFSGNTNDQDPVAEANRGLEYREYLGIFLNPTVQYDVAKHHIYSEIHSTIRLLCILFV